MPAVSTYSGVSLAQNVPTYVEGTWTPAWTNATVVGAPTYTGRYTRIGRLVFFTIKIVPAVGNTFAATAGSTFCNNFPFTCAESDSVQTFNVTTGLSVGSGFSKIATTNIYPSTLTASTTDTYVISGQVEV